MAEQALRFYVFYFDSDLEGEHTYQIVLKHKLPHRLHKYTESAYGGAMNLSRGWGRILIPEPEIDLFMELTGNRLAPEPEMHVDGGATRSGCLGLFAGIFIF